MAAITPDDIQAAYETAKLVHTGKLTVDQGRKQLIKTRSMNPNSAQDYILSYTHMMEGTAFQRANSIHGTRYYLERILKEGGAAALRTALHSLSEHIQYHEGHINAKAPGKRKLLAEFTQRLNSAPEVRAEPGRDRGPFDYPDELEPGKSYTEGAVRQVTVNAYERNPAARKQCIAHYGCRCSICGFDFEEVFGAIGRDFIHVHHLVEISSIGKNYTVDPIKDLIPVCPNCHAMLHRRSPAYTPRELKAMCR